LVNEALGCGAVRLADLQLRHAADVYSLAALTVYLLTAPG
jgi:hypothetical protein